MDKKQIASHTIKDNDTISIRAEVEKYLIHWKWFVLGILISLLGGFLYLRYATPKYQATATILIKNDKKGGLSEELAAFEDLGIVGGSGKNIDNEIEILKSRKIIADVIKKLNLTTTYFDEGRFKNTDIYLKTPIHISIDNNRFDLDTIVNIKIKSKDDFVLISELGEEFPAVSYGSVIKSSQLGSIIVEKTPYFNDSNINKNYKIVIRPINKVIDSYRKALSIYPINKKSSVLKLGIQSAITQKAEDFKRVSNPIQF